jgi:SAM-dependent methyltransferase
VTQTADHDTEAAFNFAERYRERVRRSPRRERTPEDWDARAASMSRGALDSHYARAFVARMNLEACETLLDVGCGPGTIGLSVAPHLRHVYGLDYSQGMLDAFTEQARSRGLANATPIRLGWDDDWSSVPTCDIAVASRSTAVADLEAALVKLDAIARVRVCASYPADGHLLPADMRRAVGRDALALPDYLFLVGILHDLGIRPILDFIEGRSRFAGCATFDEVLSKVEELVGPLDAPEVSRLRASYDASDGTLGQEPAAWAFVSWETRKRSAQDASGPWRR